MSSKIRNASPINNKNETKCEMEDANKSLPCSPACDFSYPLANKEQQKISYEHLRSSQLFANEQ